MKKSNREELIKLYLDMYKAVHGRNAFDMSQFELRSLLAKVAIKDIKDQIEILQDQYDKK